MPSPYSYSGPMPFQLDVWEPVGGRTMPEESEADQVAATAREALTSPLCTPSGTCGRSRP